MSTSVDTNVFDPRSLGDLKRLAKDNDPKALKAAARQFEAVFLQMVLKSMREATPHEGLLDNDQSRLYESLLDQQLAQVLATKGKGTGLAAMIEKQLSQNLGQAPAALTAPSSEGEEANGAGTLLDTLRKLAPPSVPNGAPAPASASGAVSAYNPEVGGDIPAQARDFVAQVWPSAVEASRSTGIPAHFLVAHAALETGWGRSEPRSKDGRQSFNLFGIKAGKSWNGPVVESATTEYVDGSPQRQMEKFRAYGSYTESFQDYARLLATNPRYSRVLDAKDGAGFARGLQQAGYATDPAYATKLERIISGPTLRQAMTG